MANMNNPNAANVGGPRTTPQVPDAPAARNVNTVRAPRAGAGLQNVRSPRPNVPFRPTSDLARVPQAAANASNAPAHFINIGTPAVVPGKPAGSTAHTPQNANKPATGTGQSPAGQFPPAAPIAALRNRA